MEGKPPASLADVEAVSVDTPIAEMKMEGVTTFTSRKDNRYFKTALEEPLDGIAAKGQRQLADGEHGRLQLKIVAKLVVLDSTWVLPYAFALVPIATAQVDLVESRLFDVEESLGHLETLKLGLAEVTAKVDKKLEARILEMESKMEAKLRALAPSLTEFESAGATQTGAYVAWKPVASDTFAVKNGNTIRVHCSGMYLVIVQAEYTHAYGAISMSVNGKEVIQTSLPAVDLNRQAFGCASWGMHLSKDDTLSLIAYGVSNYPTARSKMVIIKLANPHHDALSVTDATDNDINTRMLEDD